MLRFVDGKNIFCDEEIPRFQDSKIPGFQDSRIPGFQDSKIQRLSLLTKIIISVIWLNFLRSVRGQKTFRSGLNLEILNLGIFFLLTSHFLMEFTE
jgi:hypothetical protein